MRMRVPGAGSGQWNYKVEEVRGAGVRVLGFA